MFCLCFFRTFAPIFLFKFCKFVEGGRNNISCPRVQGTLDVPLPNPMNIEKSYQSLLVKKVCLKTLSMQSLCLM